MPIDLFCNDRTSVGIPSRDIPSLSISGEPEAKIAISVVVPPISRITESSVILLSAVIPIMLAAGPDRIDSTGKFFDTSADIVPPSALRMFTGESIPISFKDLIIELRKFE